MANALLLKDRFCGGRGTTLFRESGGGGRLAPFKKGSLFRRGKRRSARARAKREQSLYLASS